MATKSKTVKARPPAGKQSGTKTLEISFATRVDAGLDQEAIVAEVARVLKPLSARPEDVSSIVVRTVRRTGVSPDVSAYESRIWEKATCRAPREKFDPIRDPYRDFVFVHDEIELLRKQVADLTQKTRDLEAKIGR
jgi:hypothetical protein